MLPLSIASIKPRQEISDKTSPAPLRQALYRVFQGMGGGLWLVGGTAIAGYYAEHRRSDDLDLFAVDGDAHRAAVLAVRSLKEMGTALSNERTTPNFYRADAGLQGHAFTIDVVLDENLHHVGRAFEVGHHVHVADLTTLFAAKSACLVSRCAEKDLFDLDWMVAQMPDFSIDQVVDYGSQIDGGLNVESLLISLGGVRLRKEACQFLLPHSRLTAEGAYRKITALHHRLMQLLLEAEKKSPLLPETEALIQSLKDQRKFR